MALLAQMRFCEDEHAKRAKNGHHNTSQNVISYKSLNPESQERGKGLGISVGFPPKKTNGEDQQTPIAQGRPLIAWL